MKKRLNEIIYETNDFEVNSNYGDNFMDLILEKLDEYTKSVPCVNCKNMINLFTKNPLLYVSQVNEKERDNLLDKYAKIYCKDCCYKR